MTVLSRRAMMVSGLGFGILTATLGFETLTPAEGSVVLSEQEREVVQAVAEAMFPATELFPGAPGINVVDEVDRILSEVLDAPAVLGFRAVLRSLEWGSYASRAKRFSRLDVDSRREILDVWGAPNVLPRLAAAASLKAILGMAYFNQPTIRSAMGWRAICRGES